MSRTILITPRLADRLARLPHGRTVALGLLMCAGLSGCNNWGASDLREFVQSADKNLVGHVAPFPKPEPYQPTPYAGVGPDGQPVAPDPFQVKGPDPSARPNAAKDVPDPKRPREFLEGFGLDQLKMVGTLTGKKGHGITALVRSPDNRLNQVEVGQYMGSDYGRVVQVTPDRIVLVETVQDGGDWVDRTAQVMMTDPNTSR